MASNSMVDAAMDNLDEFASGANSRAGAQASASNQNNYMVASCINKFEENRQKKEKEREQIDRNNVAPPRSSSSQYQMGG